MIVSGSALLCPAPFPQVYCRLSGLRGRVFMLVRISEDISCWALLIYAQMVPSVSTAPEWGHPSS